MPTKKWKTEYDGLLIEFQNEWSFSLKTCENLLVNGKIVSTSNQDSDSLNANVASFKKICVGRHLVEYTDGNKKYHIKVVTGSKRPGIFLGCHIFVNGELVGGDVKSKLMFV